MYQRNPAPQDDIRVGQGRVVPHVEGGWALPGQRHTYCREEAAEMARRIHELLERPATQNEAPVYEEVKIIRRRRF